MNVVIENYKWFITDDFFDEQDWVGVSSGDIWVNDKPWADYFAYWKPNTKEDVLIMVNCVDESYETILVLAMKCNYQTHEISVIPESECPWDTLGYLVEPKDFENYTLAKQAKDCGTQIINSDPTLLKYLSISDVKLDEISSTQDEYGYRRIKI